MMVKAFRKCQAKLNTLIYLEYWKNVSLLLIFCFAFARLLDKDTTKKAIENVKQFKIWKDEVFFCTDFVYFTVAVRAVAVLTAAAAAAVVVVI